MKPICRTQTVRALDAAVIDGLGVGGRVLMELAGLGAARALHERFSEGRVGILCGWALVATLASCFPEAEHEEGFLEVTGAAAKGSAAGVCAPGEQQSCGCADGRYGTATCEHDGSGFGGCACPLPAAS